MPSLRDALLGQQRDLESALATSYVERDHHVSSLDHDLINVIIGPRRAGKSFFAANLLKQVGRFAYANFDDERLLEVEPDELLVTLDALYGETPYLLLDEIQNLPRWQLIVNRLQRQGRRLTITGSNAHVLGEELATHLTGRHLPVVILPFSFREYLRALRPTLTTQELLAALDTYAETGGYPEVVVEKVPREHYLSTLLDSVVLKDIVRRFRVRLVGGIDDLCRHLMSNFATECSHRRLARLLGGTSVHTVKKHLGYLEMAFLFFTVPRFSFKICQQVRASHKIYCVDNGLITATGFRLSPNRGRLFENIVAVELHRRRLSRQLDLYYWKGPRGEEVDFVVKAGLRVTQLIQVCADASATETRRREVRGLLKAAEDLGCRDLLVLTRNEDQVEEASWYGLAGKVHFMPLWRWLTMPEQPSPGASS